ncbi:hypothetical protein CYL16_03285 [Mycobacterium sp. EPG1]|nr:hypothetical protein CYL16_03285 [Mycobacterium sp. EPG1]
MTKTIEAQPPAHKDESDPLHLWVHTYRTPEKVVVLVHRSDRLDDAPNHKGNLKLREYLTEYGFRLEHEERVSRKAMAGGSAIAQVWVHG